jgi:hypothetical protein
MNKKEIIGKTFQVSEKETPQEKIADFSPELARKLFQEGFDVYLRNCMKVEELHVRQMNNPRVAASVSGIGRLG